MSDFSGRANTLSTSATSAAGDPGSATSHSLHYINNYSRPLRLNAGHNASVQHNLNPMPANNPAVGFPPARIENLQLLIRHLRSLAPQGRLDTSSSVERSVSVTSAEGQSGAQSAIGGFLNLSSTPSAVENAPITAFQQTAMAELPSSETTEMQAQRLLSQLNKRLPQQPHGSLLSDALKHFAEAHAAEGTAAPMRNEQDQMKVQHARAAFGPEPATRTVASKIPPPLSVEADAYFRYYHLLRQVSTSSSDTMQPAAAAWGGGGFNPSEKGSQASGPLHQMANHPAQLVTSNHIAFPFVSPSTVVNDASAAEPELQDRAPPRAFSMPFSAHRDSSAEYHRESQASLLEHVYASQLQPDPATSATQLPGLRKLPARVSAVPQPAAADAWRAPAPPVPPTPPAFPSYIQTPPPVSPLLHAALLQLLQEQLRQEEAAASNTHPLTQAPIPSSAHGLGAFVTAEKQGLGIPTAIGVAGLPAPVGSRLAGTNGGAQARPLTADRLSAMKATTRPVMTLNVTASARNTLSDSDPSPMSLNAAQSPRFFFADHASPWQALARTDTPSASVASATLLSEAAEKARVKKIKRAHSQAPVASVLAVEAIATTSSLQTTLSDRSSSSSTVVPAQAAYPAESAATLPSAEQEDTAGQTGRSLQKHKHKRKTTKGYMCRHCGQPKRGHPRCPLNKVRGTAQQQSSPLSPRCSCLCNHQ